MRQFCAFLLFGLFFCASAFPETIGTIQCEPGSTAQVPAWIEPGNPQVVEQLSCGQTVNVIDVGSFSEVLQYSSRPSRYMKVRISDKVAYVDARYVKLSETQERLKANTDGNVAAKRQRTAEEEEQRKWSLITKDNVKLRDELLVDPIYTNGPRNFMATITNNSEFPVSHLHLLLRLYDCSGKPESNYSNCEIIGEVEPIVPISVPSGQTRRLTAPVYFEATPRVRGTAAWGYRILGIRVE
jgi:hypothetical protein